jgi:hypothetical protein
MRQPASYESFDRGLSLFGALSNTTGFTPYHTLYIHDQNLHLPECNLDKSKASY